MLVGVAVCRLLLSAAVLCHPHQGSLLWTTHPWGRVHPSHTSWEAVAPKQASCRPHGPQMPTRLGCSQGGGGHELEIRGKQVEVGQGLQIMSRRAEDQEPEIFTVL